MDTIFALASAPGKAGVAVVRVSGPACEDALRHFDVHVPRGGRRLRRLLDSGEVVDEALVLHFPHGASFTGEEVIEFHLHGSQAIVQRVLSILGEISGLRHADPGEFTRRAFENGRLGLSQVEGLADLIDAETEAQRKQALRVLSGELGRRVEDWRAQLTRVLALFTAAIDFADEEIPEDVIDRVADDLTGLKRAFQTELERSRSAELVRRGFEVAIVGPPNAGKSTLLNRLAGREAAITSKVAGTTRDVIEVRMDLGGFPVTLLDTAGMRETDDEVEMMGVERARARANSADLRIFLLDSSEFEFVPEPGDIVLQGKGDLRADGAPSVSGLTGAGVDELTRRINQRLADSVGDGGLVIRQRQRDALLSAVRSIDEAIAALRDLGDDVLAAELVAAAVRALDSLIGRVDVESVLGDVFSSFCIGK